MSPRRKRARSRLVHHCHIRGPVFPIFRVHSKQLGGCEIWNSMSRFVLWPACPPERVACSSRRIHSSVVFVVVVVVLWSGSVGSCVLGKKSIWKCTWWCFFNDILTIELLRFCVWWSSKVWNALFFYCLIYSSKVIKFYESFTLIVLCRWICFFF